MARKVRAARGAAWFSEGVLWVMILDLVPLQRHWPRQMAAPVRGRGWRQQVSDPSPSTHVHGSSGWSRTPAELLGA